MKRTLKTTRPHARRFAVLLLCFCMAASFVPPLAAHAQETGKTVRVGWYESSFNQTDEFGRRSGYAYEYQQKISAYTGWRYEYVEGSWPELLQMLINGKIDLMSDVSYTDERSEIMLFSDLSMGSEEYFVFVSQGSESGISSDDFSSFNGKRIGVNKGSLQESLFRNWAEKKNLQVELVEMTTSEDESVAMLNRGELDAYVSVHSLGRPMGLTPVFKIGSSDFFFAVNKNRPELLSELNFAMSRIQEENAFYVQNLYNKYIGFSGSDLLLTPSELSWLEEHGPIRVGYRVDYLAFCAQDPETGELIGALKDFLEQASQSAENVEIEFEAVPVHSPEDSLNMLMSGEVDCLFPTNVSDYDGEVIGLSLSVPLMQTGIVALVRRAAQREFSLRGEVRVAVDEGNPDYETVLMNYFPAWEKVYFADTNACLAAVAEGKADCLLASNYRASRLTAALEEYRMTAVFTGETLTFSFAMRHEDNTLYAILNKVVNLVPASSVNASLAAYSYTEQKVTFASFIRQHMISVLTIIGIVFALILLLLLRSIYSAERARKAMKRIAVLNEDQKNKLEEISKLNTVLSESQQHLKEALAAEERANRAKTSFLSGISHEMRTPMNAIIGLDNLALRNEALDAQTRDHLEKIGASARHLLGLINEILDMSRIESGDLELKEEEFSFREFLEQVNAMAGVQCADKGLRYECKIIGKTEKTYVGDEMKLKRVLNSILDNAVKFTPTGSVRFTVEQTASFDNHRSLRFIISDTGIGMSRDFLPHIFDTFSQESKGDGNKLGSIGLGMAFAKRIMTMMNGDITIESEKGKGSTFTVTVTLKCGQRREQEEPVPAFPDGPGAPAAEDAQNAPEDTELAGRHVLVVEDIPFNAEILMDLLDMEDVSAEHAENGQIAVDMFSEHPAGTYDAILMDIRMPVMDGLEATRTIRALDRPDAKSIPIIAVTANAFEEDVQQSLQAGMNAHLSKPVEPERLYETLRRMIQP